MAADPSPTVRHRRLTRLFNELRRDSGLTREQVTEHMEWAPSKISKLESGNWKQLQIRDVRGLVELYGVTDKYDQEIYVSLARDARRRGWWTQYSDVIGPYVGFEVEAVAIQTFQPSYIPGLLQTEDYARALMRANPANDGDAADRRIAAQVERQKLLIGAEAPRLWVIVEEQTIRRPVGGPIVMRDQLRHLVEMITGQLVTFQVIPLTAGAHPGMDGSFVVLSYADPMDRPLVYLETATDGLYLEEPHDIERYTVMYEHLRATAMSTNDSLALINEVAGAL